MTHELIDATCPDACNSIARRIERIPEEFAPAFAAVVAARGIMVTDWKTRLFVRLLMLRHRISKAAAWSLIFSKVPVAARDMVEATAQWMREGTDRTSADSFGGFNQQDLVQIACILECLHDQGMP